MAGVVSVKEELLSELEEMHSHKELAVMEMHRGVEKAAEKIDTASRFTERVLTHGNGVEVCLFGLSPFPKCIMQ